MLVTVLISAGLLMLTEAGASTATAPEEEWREWGMPVDFQGEVYAVQQTSDGGYIISGRDGIIAWLLKTDLRGNEEWIKTFVIDYSAGFIHPQCVQQTADKGYIIVGIVGYTDDCIWLFKTDLNGVEQWNKTFEANRHVRAYQVQQTADGGYIIVGLGMGTYEYWGSDIPHFVAWLIKTDASGNVQWDKKFWDDPRSAAFGYSVQQTTDGGYILTGSVYHEGRQEAWLWKTDSSGNEQWRQIFVGTDEARSVQQTSDGGYIVVVLTDDLGGTLLIKTKSNGDKQWEKTFDDLGACFVRQTTDGGYVLAGDSWGDSDGTDLIKTDSKGNEQWRKTFEDIYIYQNSIQQTSDGGYIIAGMGGWLIKLGGTDSEDTGTETTSPAVTAPDIEKPTEKSIPGFEVFGAMFAAFVVFALRRRKT